MHQINLKEARRTLPKLIEQARSGEEIQITRRGKGVARLVSLAPEKPARLPSLAQFRESITAKGPALSQVVVEQRQKDRY